MKLCTIKIKRNEYDISEKDLFMDNGACVQLMTQSKERGDWGRRFSPIISLRVQKEISAFDKVMHNHNYGGSVTVFSLTKRMEK